MTHSVEMVEWEIVLEAPPVKAWRALIEPELRGRWLQDSRFTFTLAPLDRDRTRVRLHHVGLGFDGVEYRVGWYDYLVGLYLETAEPLVGRNS
jgi:uncharacterized protein YndB with AHSA1/START domain